VGVRPLKVEVELTGVGLGKKVSPASEVFEIEELVFLDAVHGFDIALAGVSSGRDVHMLAVREHFGKITFELTAVVGLPGQIAQRDTVAI
jgi:hypothetical protein